jgi:hypothetical protein
MNAVMIDKNFEFRPNNMGNYVKGTIGIICETNDELNFVVNHLEQFDLGNEYKKYLEKQQDIKPVTSQNDKKQSITQISQPETEIETDGIDVVKISSNPISSLELD